MPSWLRMSRWPFWSLGRSCRKYHCGGRSQAHQSGKQLSSLPRSRDTGAPPVVNAVAFLSLMWLRHTNFVDDHHQPLLLLRSSTIEFTSFRVLSPCASTCMEPSQVLSFGVRSSCSASSPVTFSAKGCFSVSSGLPIARRNIRSVVELRNRRSHSRYAQVLRVSCSTTFNDSLLVSEGFRLTFKGHTTSTITVNASAAEVRESSPQHCSGRKYPRDDALASL